MNDATAQLSPPWKEAERLGALQSYAVLDTPREAEFDDVVQLAAQVMGAPIAVINLIAEDRQWFKAEQGLGVRETPLDVSICAHAILARDLFVVPDTTQDSRFACNPLVKGEPHLRFYAGALLETPEGLPIGTLCVLDHRPRPDGVTAEQAFALKALARQVMTQLELRRALGQRDHAFAEERRSEAARQESAQQLQLLADALPLFVALIGRDERYQLINGTYEEWFGHPRTDLLGRSVREVLGEVAYAERRDQIQAVLAGERVIFDASTFHKDKGRRDTQVEYIPRFAEGGTVDGFYSVVTDITERKQVERALRESEARLRLAVDAGRMAIWELDMATDTLRGSPELNRLLGFPPEAEMTTEDLRARYYPGDRERVLERAAQALARGERFMEVEFRVRWPDESVRWVLQRSEVHLDPEGRPAGAVGVVLDVTERKRADEAIQENELALRESEARFRAIANSIDQMIWSTRPDGFHDYYNQRWYDYTGAPAGSTDGESWSGMFHPDDQDRAWTTWQNCLATGEPYHIEYRLRHHSGQYRWVLGRAQAMRDEEGRITRWFGTCTDIQEIVEARDVLARYQEDLEQQVAARTAERDRTWALSQDLLAVAGFDGYLKATNPAWTRLLGYEEEALLSRPFAYLIHPEDLPAAGEIVAAMQEGRTVERFEDRVRAADGSYRWISWTAVPENDLFYAIGRDVTAERQATADRDRMWRLSTDLMLVARFDATITSVNPAWKALLGWQEEELIGRPFLDLVHPDDVASTVAEAGRLSDGLVTLRFENRYRCKDGSYRWLSWTAVPDEGFIHAAARDVTGEKEAAETLRETEEALRQAQKMEAVGQLTGGIAHDFNNLLAGIVGSLDLMQTRLQQGRTADLDRYAKAAMSSAQRAAALTHRLLAFSRRQPLDPKPVAANQLVTSMEDLLRRTIGPSVGLEIVTAGGLWTTLCDPNQLESSILNLAINARDAMPEGGRLTIETANAHLDDAYVAAQRDVTPGQYVAICVTDTGSGMPPEVIARAFDPFFTTKPIGQGTGLGLSMVYGFAKQSEGHVKIYSEPGQGTTVKIYLPRYRGPVELDQETMDPGEAPRSEAGETVLVVEDEPVVRNLIVEVLQDLGYRALEAADGPSGLRMLQSRMRIDLLITDVGLPGLNGRQIADQARERRPGLRVLFITGYAENAAIGNGVLDPGMEMITKPFAVDLLAKRIRSILTGSAR